MRPKTYQDNFFNYHLEDSISSAKAVIPVVLKYIKPASVIDVGCGVGTWLSVWKEQGITDIQGVDGTYVDLKNLLIEEDKFIKADLDNGFKTNRRYDLVSCLEVAEHIKIENAENFIASLCNLGNVILFSAAIPGQEGTMHFNEQYPQFWIDLFAKYSFTPYDCVRQQIWNNEKISWWYRQNVMFFVNDKVKEQYPSITNEKQEVLPLVHPKLLYYKTRMVNGYENVLRNPYTVLRYFARKYLDKSKNILKK
jgi:hypothetical protein